MRMTIRYQDGARAEAVLLAVNCDRMRVAVDRGRDTIELHKTAPGWCTDNGEEIEIEALIAIPGVDVSRFCAELHPRAIGAGQSFLA